MVHPKLVSTKNEGDCVADYGYHAVECHSSIRIVHGFGVGLVVGVSLIQRQIVHQGNAVNVEQNGHQSNLNNAPYAQQQATNAELRATNPKSCHVWR